MSQRRMISKSIINSAKFLKMPAETQSLYFHLCLNADDDGVVEAFTVLRTTWSSEDNLRILHAKWLIHVLNEDFVSYILDWNEHNLLRADRKVNSIYQNLLLKVLPEVDLLQPKQRKDRKKSMWIWYIDFENGLDMPINSGTSQGQPVDGVVEDSIVEDSIDNYLNFSDLSELDWGSEQEKQKFMEYRNTLIVSKWKKKLRRAAEKTFSIKLRRATWIRNVSARQQTKITEIPDDIKKEMSQLQLSDSDSKKIYDRCLRLWKVTKVLVWRVESGEIAYGAPVMINKYKDWVDVEYVKWIIRKIDDWAEKNWKAIDSYWNLFIKFTDESNRKN